MLKVIDVDYLGEYKLHLIFNNNTNGWVDLQNILTFPVYAGLKDRQQFMQFGLVNGTIQWANGADLAPEYLQTILHTEASKAA